MSNDLQFTWSAAQSNRTEGPVLLDCGSILSDAGTPRLRQEEQNYSARHAIDRGKRIHPSHVWTDHHPVATEAALIIPCSYLCIVPWSC